MYARVCLFVFTVINSFFVYIVYFVAACLSGSALVSSNEVTLRRARLVLGWVTVSGG